MTKQKQITKLKKSIYQGVNSEIQSFLEDFSMKNVFEYHILDDLDNGVYNKLNEIEIDNIISQIEKELEINIECSIS